MWDTDRDSGHQWQWFMAYNCHIARSWPLPCQSWHQTLSLIIITSDNIRWSVWTNHRSSLTILRVQTRRQGARVPQLPVTIASEPTTLSWVTDSEVCGCPFSITSIGIEIILLRYFCENKKFEDVCHTTVLLCDTLVLLTHWDKQLHEAAAQSLHDHKGCQEEVNEKL